MHESVSECHAVKVEIDGMAQKIDEWYGDIRRRDMSRIPFISQFRPLANEATVMESHLRGFSEWFRQARDYADLALKEAAEQAGYNPADPDNADAVRRAKVLQTHAQRMHDLAEATYKTAMDLRMDR